MGDFLSVEYNYDFVYDSSKEAFGLIFTFSTRTAVTADIYAVDGVAVNRINVVIIFSSSANAKMHSEDISIVRARIIINAFFILLP